MRHLRHIWRTLLLQTAIFAALASTIIVMHSQSLSLLVVVSLESIASLALWHERYDVSCFTVIAVLGSLAEVIFVHFGVWEYANPTLLGVPIWFPIAFGTSGLIGARLARTLTTIWEEWHPASLSEVPKNSRSAESK